jgi:hypothetical protein
MGNWESYRMSLFLESLRRFVRDKRAIASLLPLAAFFYLLLYWALGIIDPRSTQAAKVAELLRPAPAVAVKHSVATAGRPIVTPEKKASAYIIVRGKTPVPLAATQMLVNEDVSFVNKFPNSAAPAGTLFEKTPGSWELHQEFINWMMARLSGQVDLNGLIQEAFNAEHNKKVALWVTQSPDLAVRTAPQVWLIPEFRQGESFLRYWVMGLSAFSFGGLLAIGSSSATERWRCLGQAWAEASAPLPLRARLRARLLMRAMVAYVTAFMTALLWCFLNSRTPGLALTAACLAPAGALLAGSISHVPFLFSGHRLWWKISPAAGYILVLLVAAGLWRYAVYPALVWIVYHPAPFAVITLLFSTFIFLILTHLVGAGMETRGRAVLEP